MNIHLMNHFIYVNIPIGFLFELQQPVESVEHPSIAEEIGGGQTLHSWAEQRSSGFRGESLSGYD